MRHSLSGEIFKYMLKALEQETITFYPPLGVQYKTEDAFIFKYIKLYKILPFQYVKKPRTGKNCQISWYMKLIHHHEINLDILQLHTEK